MLLELSKNHHKQNIFFFILNQVYQWKMMLFALIWCISSQPNQTTPLTNSQALCEMSFADFFFQRQQLSLLIATYTAVWEFMWTAWVRQEPSQKHCVKIHFLCDMERDTDPSITQRHYRHCFESRHCTLSTHSLSHLLSPSLKHSHAECTHKKKHNI